MTESIEIKKLKDIHEAERNDFYQIRMEMCMAESVDMLQQTESIYTKQKIITLMFKI